MTMLAEKKLMVIAEVPVGNPQRPLRSAALDIRLQEYANNFSEVIYVGPCDQASQRFVSGKVRYIGANLYSKKIRPRLAYVLNRRRRREFFRALINEFAPDIVEIRIPALFSLLSYEAISSTRTPLATYVAGDWETALSSNLRFPGVRHVARWLDRRQWSLIRASVPVVAGEALAAKYRHINECYVYRSTTHRQVYRRAPRFPPRRLTYFGTLEPLKRVEDAVLALDHLRRAGFDFELDIVGDGPSRDELQRLVQELGLQDRVRFHGYVREDERKRQLFLDADVLLLPSVSEGSPKVLPEAMAHGVLAIAIEGVGGIGGIITHGSNGLLARPRDPQHLASLLQDLTRSRERLVSMVEAGYEYAARHTLPEEVRKQWAHVARRIQARAGGPTT